jgi:hypothetical protein
MSVDLGCFERLDERVPSSHHGLWEWIPTSSFRNRSTDERLRFEGARNATRSRWRRDGKPSDSMFQHGPQLNPMTYIEHGGL